MNRDYIIDNDIVGRYVAGTLSEGESEAFELAYFNDEELAAMVLTEQRLRFALAPHKNGAVTAFPHWSSRRSLLTRVAAMAAVVLPTAWLLSTWQSYEGSSPRVFTQVLTLHSVRGVGGGPSLPASTDSNAMVALHIDASQVPKTARSAVLIPDGLSAQPLASFEQQQIDQSNGLIIQVPAIQLPPGTYVLELRDSDGAPARSLPFRITLPD
ncbi:MAG: hypothetical protein AAGA68_22105 [Pseudomonadota bacterium]